RLLQGAQQPVDPLGQFAPVVECLPRRAVEQEVKVLKEVRALVSRGPVNDLGHRMKPALGRQLQHPPRHIAGVLPHRLATDPRLPRHHLKNSPHAPPQAQSPSPGPAIQALHPPPRPSPLPRSFQSRSTPSAVRLVYWACSAGPPPRGGPARRPPYQEVNHVLPQ